MLEFSKVTVTNIIQETKNTRRFFLTLENKELSNFKAGQFITLDLPISDKKAKRLRSYSIANMPNQNGILELVIVLLEGGAGTTYLFNEVSIGSVLDFRGPLGHFTLPEPLPSNIFLICTGTGIAPFRSMILDIVANKLPIKAHLIMGSRFEADLLYHEELTDLAANNENIVYTPTLSREAWDGAKGYVHEVYASYATKDTNAHFMLCGWRAMIDEARQKLADFGIDKKQVHFELYG